MNRKEAIEILKQCLEELSHLKELQYDNREYQLWRDKVEQIVKSVFSPEDLTTLWSTNLLVPTIDFLTPETVRQNYYLKRLNEYGVNIEKIIQKYELLGIEAEPSTKTEAKDTIKLPLQLFDAMQFHPKVVEASRELFKDGHYRDAIYRAFVEVNNFVKDKANSQLDGRRLMSTVFSPDNPIIKLNPLKTQSDKDEQEGFMFLFMGAMEGIRNPKAHENIIQNDPYKALEYLSFASLLMQTIDFWEAEET